uniref:ORF47 n=1 Tax=Leptospirillum ferrooxidans TaxID=180 RepID=Q58KD0_9BACT|nr:ORF47 [Leptospirillum ferrooxidans]
MTAAGFCRLLNAPNLPIFNFEFSIFFPSFSLVSPQEFFDRAPVPLFR